MEYTYRGNCVKASILLQFNFISDLHKRSAMCECGQGKRYMHRLVGRIMKFSRTIGYSRLELIGQ